MPAPLLPELTAAYDRLTIERPAIEALVVAPTAINSALFPITARVGETMAASVDVAPTNVMTLPLISVNRATSVPATPIVNGLAVAVPAVLGYNWLIRRNKSAMEEVRSFGADLHAVLLSSAQTAARA